MKSENEERELKIESSDSLLNTENSCTENFSFDTVHVENPITPKLSEENKYNFYEKKYIVVCAIDFGTTYSGYAFSFVKSPETIHMMKIVGDNAANFSNRKIPTVLLLDENMEFHSFGYDAKTFYLNLGKKEARKYNYFEKFKMNLHSVPSISDSLLIRSSNGNYCPAIEIFSKSIMYFKEEFSKELDLQTSARIKISDVKWVITVPAIWRDEAKQFMRRACYNAGLASPEEPEKLTIALEPEAASIYCRKLRLRDCSIEEDLINQVCDLDTVESCVRKYKRYIIVDCGGGTVDISIHELDYKTETLKEIRRGIGGPYGGIQVDNNFFQLLNELMGEQFVNNSMRKHPSSWIELMEVFENRKRFAKPYNKNGVRISIPHQIVKNFQKSSKLGISTLRKTKSVKNNWKESGQLVLEPNIMMDLFSNVIRNINSFVHEILSDPETNDVRYMFLVGGFSDSPILQNELRNEFQGRLTIIIPNDAGLCILKGAVLFGMDPFVVRIRRSSYTYGIRTLRPFNEKIHSPDKKITINGAEYCRDLLSVIVKANDSISPGDKVIRKFKKNSKEQKDINIDIYRSQARDVIYTTDPRVHVCANLNVNCDSEMDESTEIIVTIYFGDVEIKLKIPRQMKQLDPQLILFITDIQSFD